MKIALTPQEEMLPETAVLIDTNLPSTRWNATTWIRAWISSIAGSSTTSGRWADRANFVASHLHRSDAAIGFAQSWIFERTFGDSLTGYAEWAMLSLDTPPDPDTAQYIDGGLLYLVTDNVQFDASVGYGLDELAMDYFCGFGVTIRR